MMSARLFVAAFIGNLAGNTCLVLALWWMTAVRIS